MRVPLWRYGSGCIRTGRDFLVVMQPTNDGFIRIVHSISYSTKVIIEQWDLNNNDDIKKEETELTVKQENCIDIKCIRGKGRYLLILFTSGRYDNQHELQCWDVETKSILWRYSLGPKTGINIDYDKAIGFVGNYAVCAFNKRFLIVKLEDGKSTLDVNIGGENCPFGTLFLNIELTIGIHHAQNQSP